MYENCTKQSKSCNKNHSKKWQKKKRQSANMFVDGWLEREREREMGRESGSVKGGRLLWLFSVASAMLTCSKCNFNRICKNTFAQSDRKTQATTTATATETATTVTKNVNPHSRRIAVATPARSPLSTLLRAWLA